MFFYGCGVRVGGIFTDELSRIICNTIWGRYVLVKECWCMIVVGIPSHHADTKNRILFKHRNHTVFCQNIFSC